MGIQYFLCRPGLKLVVDGGFECLAKGDVRTIQADAKNALYIDCHANRHFLAGHVRSDGTLAGFTLAPESRRWCVELDRRYDAGIKTENHFVEEIADLDRIVEQGPDWHSIVQIRVHLNPVRASYVTTVEQAEKR